MMLKVGRCIAARSSTCGRPSLPFAHIICCLRWLSQRSRRHWLYNARDQSCHWYCLLLQRGPTSRMASAHCSFSRLVACRAALVADVAHYMQQEVTIEGVQGCQHPAICSAGVLRIQQVQSVLVYLLCSYMYQLVVKKLISGGTLVARDFPACLWSVKLQPADVHQCAPCQLCARAAVTHKWYASIPEPPVHHHPQHSAATQPL
jgi:hypothetical protein